MQKQSVWVLWIGSLAAMIIGSGGVATAGRWVFGLVFAVHVVEFLVFRSVMQRAGGSMTDHFIQTMIYGFFHWAPIKERLEAEDAG